MTRAFLPLLALAAVVLAACVPVTPPAPPPPPQPVSQYCAPSTPTSAGTYQAAFDNLRKTYTEWASADGAVPIPVQLSPSRTLWLFGDTFIGKVSSSGTITATKLVSNSAVLQTGRCFKPIMGGAPLARSAWIPPPAANHAYWPASAVVDTTNDRLDVLLMHVVQQPGSPFVSGLGTRIARFRASTLAPLGVTGTIPGTSELRPYGSTAFQEGSTAYLYSSNGGDFHLARAPVATVADQATWAYWTGPDDVWSPEADAAQALEFAAGTEEVGPLDVDAPIAPLRVQPYGEGYLGTAMKIDGITDGVLVYTAPTPFGPWTEIGTIATTPSNVRSYGAQTIFGLQGVPSTGAVTIYSTNVSGTPSTISQYGPRFVTPTNLPALLEATAEGETPEPTPPPTSPTTNPTTLPPSTLPPTSTSTTEPSTTTSSPPP